MKSHIFAQLASVKRLTTVFTICGFWLLRCRTVSAVFEFMILHLFCSGWFGRAAVSIQRSFDEFVFKFGGQCAS
jgi:hypothetical protein